MQQPLPEQFLEFIGKHALMGKDDTIIAAVSGGVDSIVLVHLLLRMKQPVVLAHCNFQLRGDESHRDERFVHSMAEKWNLPIYTERYNTLEFAGQHQLSTQVAARELRYTFFERLRKSLSLQGKSVWIATAHHANDAAETMLVNLFRGTGIDGLKGIPVKNGFIIRPLLFALRNQIESYAAENGLDWVEDSSNAKEDYARNMIRLSVLPVVEKKYPQVIQNLWGTMEKMQEAAALFHQIVEQRLRKMLVIEEGVQKIPVLKIAKASEHKTLVWEWIKGFGFTEGQVAEVVKLFGAGNGSYIDSGSHRLVKNRAWLELYPILSTGNVTLIIEQLPAEIPFFDNLILHVSGRKPWVASKAIPLLNESEALIDSANLILPLLLRKWKAGDYFYPLGMAKKKKVARFLIDRKISPHDKQHVWVLESNKRIVWVVGHRIDERFKITPNTKEVVKMKMKREDMP